MTMTRRPWIRQWLTVWLVLQVSKGMDVATHSKACAAFLLSFSLLLPGTTRTKGEERQEAGGVQILFPRFNLQLIEGAF